MREALLDCGREAAALGGGCGCEFGFFGVLARLAIQAGVSKRQLRGRSPKGPLALQSPVPRRIRIGGFTPPSTRID
jgi:hypothetical protein